MIIAYLEQRNNLRKSLSFIHTTYHGMLINDQIKILI